MKPLVLLTVLLLVPVSGGRAQSVDIAVDGHGLSIGNSSRFTGIRVNAIDRQVEQVTGLNLTLWNPGLNPDARYNGIMLGLIGTKAKRIDGIAIGGIGVNAREQLRGVAAGALGVATTDLSGVAAGGIMVDVKERLRGVGVGGLWTGNDSVSVDGLAVSLGAVMARNLKGVAIGGVFAASEARTVGLALSPGGVYAGHMRGLAIGGVAAGGEDVGGIAVSLGAIGGKRLDGLMLAGLGLGATERIRGIAVGGVVLFAPEMTGVAMGAMNGFYIDRINLEDFLHFNMVNQRFTGLSIGLVNYTAELKGVQLGLINYAGNNPRWLRLLPFVNMHF